MSRSLRNDAARCVWTDLDADTRNPAGSLLLLPSTKLHEVTFLGQFEIEIFQDSDIFESFGLYFVRFGCEASL
jgi:hypothetical protein